jgi:hypothetical protein
MKVRSIAILAAAVMVIAATGIGDAFAYTYSGTDQSNNNNGVLSRDSTAGGDPTVQGGEKLYLENGFYNTGTDTYYGRLKVNGVIKGTSPALGQYGYWWPDTAEVTAPSNPGSYSIDVKHYWSTSSSSFSSYVQFNNPYHV